MNDLLTVKDVAEKFGLKRQTIRRRLLREERAGYDLHGCKKIGRDWFVTEQYIRNREWRKLNRVTK